MNPPDLRAELAFLRAEVLAMRQHMELGFGYQGPARSTVAEEHEKEYTSEWAVRALETPHQTREKTNPKKRRRRQIRSPSSEGWGSDAVAAGIPAPKRTSHVMLGTRAAADPPQATAKGCNNDDNDDDDATEISDVEAISPSPSPKRAPIAPEVVKHFVTQLSLVHGYGPEELAAFRYVGNDRDQEWYFKKCCGTKKTPPPHASTCLCGQPLEYNAWILNPSDGCILAIGMDCARHFLRHGTKLTCDVCLQPHRNARAQKTCNDCVATQADRDRVARAAAHREGLCENLCGGKPGRGFRDCFACARGGKCAGCGKACHVKYTKCYVCALE